MTRTTLADLTVGELRALVHGGGDENATLADALASMTATNESTAAHEAAWAAHQAATAEWIAGRGQAIRDARAAAGHSSHDQSTGATHAAGVEAGTDAAQAYERRVPRPTFNGKPTVPLEYSESEKQGRLAAAVDKVKELVS